MKAQEYIDNFGPQFKNAKSADETTMVLASLLTAFMNETDELIKIRKAHSNEAIVSIFKELNAKWNKMVRLDPSIGLKLDGFKAWCQSQYGDILVHYWT